MSDWKPAALGGLGGAVLALAVVLGLAATGRLPENPDKSVHDYLMAHPEILVAMSSKLQSQQEDAAQATLQGAVDKVGLKAFFNPKVAFVTGPQNAKTTIAEFFDYNCVHCRNSFAAVQKFYKAHPDARFAFIEFPIFGADSDAAARLAIAARKQPDKYVAFHFAIMGINGPANQAAIYDAARKTGLDIAKLTADSADPAITAEIAAAHALGEAAKVDGTPTFVIDGKAHAGEVNDQVLKAMTKT
jgi:protein-disulfide isomerase